MIDSFEWPDETEDAESKAAPLFEEELPAGHRSGFVAVVGRPNVGKSTLMNHYLGQKIAIVSPKPQTTRNQLLGILTLPSDTQPELSEAVPPAQVVFVDTPGIHRPHHSFGQYMVDTALEAISDVDLVLWLVDGTEPPTPDDELAAAALHELGSPPPVILVLNKGDLLTARKAAGIEQPFLALYPADEWLLISAFHSQDRIALLRQITEYLPPGPRYFPTDQITDQQTRFLAGELIREAALKVLHQELPHALAVQVIEFKGRHQDLTYISANLILERQSQKKIVIGAKGRTLKKIGRMARPEIEELVGTKIYLDLWVKVRPKWRKKESELRWLGYSK